MWIDKPQDPPPYLVGPAPPGVQFVTNRKPFLHDGLAKPDGLDKRDPLYGGLHRVFAGLDGPEQIRLFANRYGWLGQGGLNLSEVGGGSVWLGEPLARWTKEIAVMGALLETWEQVQFEDREALAKRVRWHRGPPVQVTWWPNGFDEGKRFETLAKEDYEDERIGWCTGTAPSLPAQRRCRYCSYRSRSEVECWNP